MGTVVGVVEASGLVIVARGRPSWALMKIGADNEWRSEEEEKTDELKGALATTVV
jgi:hypothetical protein